VQGQPPINPQLISLAIGGLLILVIFFFRFRAAGKARPLQPGMLLLRPVILVALGAWLVFLAKPTDPQTIGIMAACLAVGAAIGWWRGRFVHIEVHPETHSVTSVTPAFAVMILVGLFVARFAVRYLVMPNADPLSLETMRLNAYFVLSAVGILGFASLEMYLRAQKLLNEARSASAKRAA
jgi:membrane protein CcdC involved in cytochrome C biogenesis